MQLVNLDTFVRVAELGSMAAAARALGVPKSTIGRRIESLEAELRVALLRRTSRQVTLTAEGRALQARCAEPLRELQHVEQILGDQDAKPKGRLVVSVTADAGESLALDLIAGFSELYPEVQVEIQAPHLRLDWRQPLLDEGVDVVFDLALPSQPAEGDPDAAYLVVRLLRTVRVHLFGSPGYLGKMGTPKSLNDLGDHRLVSPANPPFDQMWPVQEGAGPVRNVPVRPQFLSLAPPVLLGLVLSGTALGLIPTSSSIRHEQRGRLIRLLPSWSLAPMEMRVIWLRTRHLAPRIRAFVDYVQAELPKLPWLE